jgi:branched-chain amino acid transport system substrate-binding protein
MKRRQLIQSAALAVAAPGALLSGAAIGQEKKFKIGMILPMTGGFASTGRQIDTASRLWMQQHGDKVAGHKVEIIVKDDGNMPDASKRLAQELLVNEKVNVLAGFGLTPLALAVAPLATQARTPMVIMAAATSSIIDTSPYIIRTSQTIPQVTIGVADWAPKNGIKRVVSLVFDYGPGHDAERVFKDRFTAAGGQVLEQLRVPVRNPDFAPYLQKVRDLKPDAVFVFTPAGPGTAFMKQFAERGLAKVGIKLIGHGAVVDDDGLPEMGDVAIGVVTSDCYSPHHDSPLNKQFVAEFGKLDKGGRPNFFGVAGYDGMRVIYEALRATNGNGGGDALLAAMRGQSFESPRGMISIDPKTRDIVQDIYIRKVEKINGKLWNVEFDSIKKVRDYRPA